MRNRTFALRERVMDILSRLRLEKRVTLGVSSTFVVAYAIVLIATQYNTLAIRQQPSRYQPGTVAEKDFVVSRDFPYVDEKATQIKREARVRLVPPVYDLDDEVGANALLSFDRFSQEISRLVSRGSSVDSIILKVLIDFPDAVERSDLYSLLRYPEMTWVLENARAMLEVALSRGIVDMQPHREEILAAGCIDMQVSRDGRVQTEEVPLDLIITPENIEAQMEQRAAERTQNEKSRRLALAVMKGFAVENAFFDQENTLVNRNRVRAEVDPVTEKLAKGQILARKGDIVSEGTAAKIKALGEFARSVDINGIVGTALFLILVLAFALYLFSLKQVSIPLRRSGIFLMLGMFLVHLILGALAARLFQLPDWVPLSVLLPTSSLSMLVAILISTPVAVFFSLAVSLPILLLTGMNVQVVLFAFLSGVAGTAVVVHAQKRIDLIRAGILLALLDSAILAVLGLLANDEPGRFLSLVGWGILNGFLCGILTLGFLPIFEHLLNAPTRFKLMELSDLNSPIFKRMLSKAPGTYTHSISVANLAETACEAIGANSLLARVGAYYHDIGKVEQAEYFIENQKSFNRHDQLKPSISVAVIKSHVRLGIEKAKELNLPQAIIDIIAQHHGRGLITYFYHRAMTEGKNPRISRDDYSYPGVRPKSREAAVLMLADAVEAASRTLKKPTEVRLERLIWEIIMDKFNAGELGDSNLTLRDLESIKRSFIHILEGHLHTRIEYPKISPEKGEAR